MHDFELIFEYDRAVAAILPQRLGASQLRTLYSLLPPNSCIQTELQNRWGVECVISTQDWAAEQLHRKPMFRKRGVRFQFSASGHSMVSPS